MDYKKIIGLLSQGQTPFFAVDESLVRENLAVLEQVQREAGCEILLALKGFAMSALFPLIKNSLAGVCASGANEARFGREKFGKLVHTFAPAFTEKDFAEVMCHSDHIIFNSFSQYEKHRGALSASGKKIECGLRINPEKSTGHTAIYDPCGEFSRLGIIRDNFDGRSIDGISGLHFHTLCEQNSDALEATLEAVEEKFGDILSLPQIKWLNMGGGHHITRSDYDIPLLIKLIKKMKEKYSLAIYLEPGEAVVLNTGFFVTTVLDTFRNGIDIAILDSSAACHTPDVIEMPYRPEIIGAGLPGEKKFTFRLGGTSCLAGDIFGDYSFDAPLKPGDRIIFTDMAHYSMVKTNTFNGVALPSLAVIDSENGTFRIIKSFGYEDYAGRLG